MNDTPDSEVVEEPDEPPILELRQIPDETDDDFFDRVHRAVRRHLFGSHIVDICIIGSGLMLLQLVFMAAQVTNQDRSLKGDAYTDAE